MFTSKFMIDLLARINPNRRNRRDKKLNPYYNLLTSELKLTQYMYFLHVKKISNMKDITLRVNVLTPLLKIMMDDAHSIGLLISQKFVNESYVLLRALYERTLNYCYLTVAPDDEFMRWLEYSFQKKIRLFRKEIIVGDWGMKFERSDYQKIWDRPKVNETMKKYQRRVSGKEKNEWSRLTPNRLARIEWIAKNYPHIDWENLSFIEMMFYSESSEAIHGTFYGAVFHTGFFESYDKSMDTLDIQRRYCGLLFSAVILLLNTVIGAANYKLNCQEYFGKSRENTKAISVLLRKEIELFKEEENEEADLSISAVQQKYSEFKV
jgi:hypothetical protein